MQYYKTTSILLRLSFFLGVFFMFIQPAHSLDSIGPDSVTSEDQAFPDVDKPYMTKEFEITGPGLLKVFTVAGDINVEPSSTVDNVKVELYLDRGFAFWSNSQNLDNFRINMLQRGNEIVASVERKKRETGFFSDRMSFSFRVYVPERMSTHLKTLAGNIELQNLQGKQSVKTGGGSINISDINGRLEAYTAGGDIKINRSKGTIYAQTEGGKIYLDDNSGEIRLKSNGGRIVSERTSGTMLAQVGGGDIWANFVQVGKGINLETSAGNIHLDVPDHMGYDLSLKGTKVDFSDPEKVRGETDPGQIEGTYKDGGPPIDLSTNAGTVTLNIK